MVYEFNNDKGRNHANKIYQSAMSFYSKFIECSLCYIERFTFTID